MAEKIERLTFWAAPLLALQFLTRIPVPLVARLSPEVVKIGLGRAVGWFPLVGALVGCITALMVTLCDEFWPRTVAVVLALIIEARLTGAFHEDAVADFCDAFGGGWTRDDTLRIMKDSRIGSYGALGLTLAVALRAALMITLSPAALVISIVAAATAGRLLVVLLMASAPPAAVSSGLTKDIGARVEWPQYVPAILLSAPILVVWCQQMPRAALLALALSITFLVWFRALLMRRLGGSTGDCLGFAAYAGQLIVLLTATLK